ncbi:NVEALA domain-containing protein [Alistipes communis]|uniref:NVEALA domain-containing protein n=1 Tax=Alistipes communis TaxID=2585118 RepID=UPI003D18DB17
MKKRLVFVGIIGLLVAVITEVVSSNRDTYSELMNANVEALTRGETETTWSCDGSDHKECEAYCGACGTSVSGRGQLRGRHSCNY